MSHNLTTRERRALELLRFDHKNFHVSGDLVGIGTGTLGKLEELGLVEVGKGRFAEKGWRITPDAWVCMFGKTYEEIVASKPKDNVPLTVWQWPRE